LPGGGGFTRFHVIVPITAIVTKTKNPATAPPVKSGVITLFQSSVVAPICSDCIAVTAAVGITVWMALVIAAGFT